MRCHRLLSAVTAASTLVLAAYLTPARAGTHTWTGANSGNWSDPLNWTGGTPAGDAAADLVFPTGAANQQNFNDLSGLTLHSIAFNNSGYSINGNALNLSNGILANGNGIDVVSFAVILTANQSFTVNGNSALFLYGNLTGSGNITKAGDGGLATVGINSYAGTTTLQTGNFSADETSGQTAIPGNLVIGDGMLSSFNTYASMYIDSNNVIAGGAAVTVNADGFLDLGRGIQSVSKLNLNPNGTLGMAIDGANPGYNGSLPYGYGQINLVNAVNLNGATLLPFNDNVFTPTAGETFTVLQSSGGVTGTFAGIANGAGITAYGQTYKVNYLPNSVVLTATPEPATVITLLIGSLLMAAGAFRHRRKQVVARELAVVT